MSHNQSNKEISSAENAKLIAPNEIKQEPGIKEELMEIDDLVEFPAIINVDVGQQLGHAVYGNGGDDTVSIPMNEVKIEVKLECTGKKKKKKQPRAKGKNKGALDNRQVQPLSVHVDTKERESNPGKAFKLHRCDQCEFVTKHKGNLKQHLPTHSAKKPFPCNHCSKEFVQKRYLQYHMKMHVGMSHFNCSICLEGFDEKDNKLEHERDCRVLRYECHLCKQSFGRKKCNLIGHFQIHSGEKPFNCTECSKQFATDGNLKTHMKLHAGPRSFHCLRCRFGFVQQNEMVAHQQKCSRRLYECYVCGKLVSCFKRNLTRHMYTHTGDKPFQCMVCLRKFTRKCNLKSHMNRFHNKTN